MTQRRYDPEIRKEAILTIACGLVVNGATYYKLSREKIAAALDVSEGTIQYHFCTMKNLRRAMMRHAIKHEVLLVIAQGLAARDVYAGKAPQELKNRAIDSLK